MPLTVDVHDRLLATPTASAAATEGRQKKPLTSLFDDDLFGGGATDVGSSMGMEDIADYLAAATTSSNPEDVELF